MCSMDQPPFDYISLPSDEYLQQNPKFYDQVHVNVVTQRPFSITLFKITEQHLQSVAQRIADAIWEDYDFHCAFESLTGILPPRLLERTTQMYIIKTLDAQEGWEKMFQTERIRRLSKWIRTCTTTLSRQKSIAANMTEKYLILVKSFIDLCIRHNFYEMAVFMAAMSRDWDTVGSVVRLGPSEKEDLDYSSRLLLFLNSKTPWEIVADVIKYHFGRDQLSSLQLWEDLFTYKEMELLAQKCQFKGLRKWSLFFYARAKKWKFVKMFLNTTTDTDTIDLMLLTAMSHNRWKIAEELLAKCSMNKMLLLKVFEMAMGVGEVDLVNKVLPLVDLQQLGLVVAQPVHFVFSSIATLFSQSDAEEMAKLCIKAGLSTHCEKATDDIVCQVLLKKNVTLAKLLRKSGVVSLTDCHKALADQEVQELAQMDPKMRQTVDDMLDYLATKEVMTLSELCRLRVSHLIGFQPGRQQRVAELPIPNHTKWLVEFGDLC